MVYLGLSCSAACDESWVVVGVGLQCGGGTSMRVFNTVFQCGISMWDFNEEFQWGVSMGDFNGGFQRWCVDGRGYRNSHSLVSIFGKNINQNNIYHNLWFKNHEFLTSTIYWYSLIFSFLLFRFHWYISLLIFYYRDIHLTKIVVAYDHFHDEIRWQSIWKHERPLKSRCDNVFDENWWQDMSFTLS